MRILTPCAYCYPESMAASAASKDLVDEYVRSGVVSVNYAPVPSRGISDEVREIYKKKRDEELRDGHIIIHRFPMFREGQNVVLRALRYLLCTVIEYFLCIKEKDIDIVYGGSTPPTQGMLCALVAKRLKVPFVYNLQDIFPDSLVSAGLTHKGSFVWKIGRWIEDYTYRHADKIIVISEGFKLNIMAKGVPEEKIEVIYNWVDQNAVVDVPRENNKLFEKYQLDSNKFYLTYCGNIGLTQNMDMLLDVAKEIKDTLEDIRIVIVGEGVAKSYVENRIKEEKIGNVILLPFQPYEDISHVFSLGDVGLVISKPGVGANSVPSKTWSIMSASRPVLASFDENELKEIIEQNRCGVFTEAGDKDAFKAAILKLYANRDLCREYGMHGRQFISSNLTKEIGTRMYVDALKSAVSAYE